MAANIWIPLKSPELGNGLGFISCSDFVTSCIDNKISLSLAPVSELSFMIGSVLKLKSFVF